MGEPNVEGPGGLLDQLSWEQLRAWQEYATLEPFGEERADLRAAIIASTVANVNIVDARKFMSPGKFMARRWFDPTDGDTGSGDGGPPTAEGWQRFAADAKALAEATEAETRPRRPPPRPSTPASVPAPASQPPTPTPAPVEP